MDSLSVSHFPRFRAAMEWMELMLFFIPSTARDPYDLLLYPSKARDF